MNLYEPALRVPSLERSTFFNIDSSVGFWLGSLAGTFMGPISGLFALGAGWFIGGQVGKNRIEREHTEGKLVAPPALWNKHTIIGAGVGELCGSLAGIFALVGGNPGLALACTATGAVIGGIMGSRVGYRKQSEEYEFAKAYVRKYGEFVPQHARGQSPELGHERAHTVTPQEAEILAARMSGAVPSFGQKIENQPESTRQL